MFENEDLRLALGWDGMGVCAGGISNKDVMMEWNEEISRVALREGRNCVAWDDAGLLPTERDEGVLLMA